MGIQKDESDSQNLQRFVGGSVEDTDFDNLELLAQRLASLSNNFQVANKNKMNRYMYNFKKGFDPKEILRFF